MSFTSKNKYSTRTTLIFLILLFLVISFFFISYNGYFNTASKIQLNQNNKGSNLLVTPIPTNRTTSYLLEGNKLKVTLPSTMLFLTLPSGKISEIDYSNPDSPNVTLFKNIKDKNLLESCLKLPPGRSCGGQYLIFNVEELALPSGTNLQNYYTKLIDTQKTSAGECMKIDYVKLGVYNTIICDKDNMRTIREIYLENNSKIYLFTGISYDYEVSDLVALQILNDMVVTAEFK